MAKALVLDGFTLPDKCENCRLEVYNSETTSAVCVATGAGVAWCRKTQRPWTCPLVEKEVAEDG